jgi:aminopeptidase N
VSRPRGAALTIAVLLTAAACSQQAASTTSTQPPSGTSTSLTAPSSTVAPTTTSAAATSSVPGSSGGGDPYFPDLGNPGYDVEHYLLDLTVDPEANTLQGGVSITASATEDLDSFHLDFLGLAIDALTVDGIAAPFSREGGELIVDPSSLLPAGEEFTVEVDYHGTPVSLNTLGFPLGWVDSGDITYVVSEPDAARTWFPCSDHPGDKAAFTFRITVPEGVTVAANGSLAETVTGTGNTTFVWEMPQPMATYLATVVIGHLDRVERLAPGGVLLRDYLPADMEGQLPPALEKVPQMLGFFAGLFGPYPFAEYGHAVVPGVPGALEDQTLCVFGRPLLSMPAVPGVEEIVAHELSHQWFGDSVTPSTWQDVWLNEGFATFAEWLWLEHDQGQAAFETALESGYEYLAEGPHPLPGDPGPSGQEMFDPSVYLRGGLTLQALRVAVGNDTTLSILRAWADRYAYGNATTADFVALAEELSGRDLGGLFDAWLYQEALPPLPEG